MNDLFKVRPISAENDKFIICIGDQQASKKEFDSEEKAKKYIKSKPWELLFAFTITISKAVYKMEEAEKEK